MSEITLFFIAQSLILVLAIVAAYVGTKVQIAKLEVKVSTLQTDHAGLAKKLDGVSRNLAELSGSVKGLKA